MKATTLWPMQILSIFVLKPYLLRFVDPAFSTVFDGSFEEIHFKAPSVVSG